MKKQLSSTALLLVLLPAGILHAETSPVPDAGSLMQQQRPQRDIVPDQFKIPEIKRDVTPGHDEVLVSVKAFRFRGGDGLADQGKLQHVVGGWIGRTLSLSQLQEVAQAVTEALKEDGWFLPKVNLAPQDVADGVVTYDIVIAKSDGDVQYNRIGKVRIRQRTLDGYANDAVKDGEPLRSYRLERAVLLVGSQPGVTAKGVLEAGSKPGTSKMIINLQEGPLLTGGATGDNHGNRYTGTWRAGAAFSINDLSGYGDLMTLQWTQSSGLRQGAASYTFPITCSGLRAILGYTGMHYELGEELAFFNMDGNSNTLYAGLSYPLLLQERGSVLAQAKYHYRDFEDHRGALISLGGHSNSVTLSVNGDHYDQLFGSPGYNVWNIGMTAGRLERMTLDFFNGIVASPLNGGYARFNGGYTRVQRVADRTIFNLAVNGQAATRSLDSSEKFVLGGPYGVRAWPVGEAGGDQGGLVNAELRYDLPVPSGWGRWQLFGFYDAGYIELQKHQTQPAGNATNRNAYWLQGAGIGLNFNSIGRLNLQCVWASAVGDNPGRIAGTGNNSDGTNDRNRLWLTSTLYF